MVLGDPALPAALELWRDQVQAFGHRVGDKLQVVIRPARVESPGQRRLFQNRAGIVRREGVEHPAELARAFDHPGEVVARDLGAVGQAQDRAFGAHLDQIVIQGGLILQVDLGLAARDFVQRRLRDVEIAALDQLRHLAEEEGQQQRADMGAVDVGVGHDHDLVVAQLADVEFVAADPGAKRGDQSADLLAGEHPVEAGAFHVQDLAAQGQDGLIATAAALLGAAPRRVAFDEEKFGLRRVAFLAIGQFSGQRGHIQRGLAPGQLARLAGGFAGQRGLDDLADDDLRGAGVLLEPFGQLLVHQVLDRRTHLGADQLILGLAGEFRVRHLDRKDAGQPFTRVVAGEIHLLALGDARGLGVRRDRPGQRAAETGKVGAAVALGNVVCERQYGFVVAVVPPHRDLDPDAVLLADHVDRFRHDGGFRAVDVFHEFPHAAFVEQLNLLRFGMAFVLQDDPHAGVQEGQLPQPGFQRLEAVIKVGESPVRPVDLGRGKKAHLGPALAGGGADLVDMHRALAILEPRAVFGIVAPDRQLQPFRQRVDHGHAHAVQAARDLVGVATLIGVVELPARVQLGHDDLGRRNAFLGVDVDRDAAAVVEDGNAVIGVDFDHHRRRVARQRLVDAVIDDLVHHMVQARAVVGVADIHAGPLANSLQPLENLDGIGAVFGGLLGRFGHAWGTLVVARDL